jgi:hypothetical protein
MVMSAHLYFVHSAMCRSAFAVTNKAILDHTRKLGMPLVHVLVITKIYLDCVSALIGRSLQKHKCANTIAGDVLIADC